MGISRTVRDRVRAAALNRCGYCHAPQVLVLGPLEIEHLLPEVRGGGDDEDNLWLACSVCNSHKATKVSAEDPSNHCEVPLFNPRHQSWNSHFQWDVDGAHLLGVTSIGRATIVVLHLNDDQSVSLRTVWVSYGAFPPHDDARSTVIQR
ncbi:HNH endonuclease [Anatilimnocola floriformis]|uniref:HNH endonuclease n=1 Tax=Anatilimnocola floriformis TaxID=2948575 RepID=UPI0036F276BD